MTTQLASKRAELNRMTREAMSEDDPRRALMDEIAELESRADVAASRDAQQREWRDITEDLSCRSYVEAVMNDRRIEGREAEFNRERGLSDDMLPIAALQDRADTVCLLYTSPSPRD